MRPISQREFRLLLVTVSLVLLGLTWLVVRGQLDSFAQLRERKDAAELTALRQQTLLQRQPELIESLEQIRNELPRHPVGQDLKSTFTRQVQSLAQLSELQVTSLTPDPEELLEELELYRTAMRGSWEGMPPAIVGFLFELQELGAVADIQDLRVRNRSGREPSLSGSFVIEFVYVRTPQSDRDEEADSPPQTFNDGDPE